MNEFITLTPENHPPVFSRENDKRASEKYCHVNTDEAVNALAELGWRNYGTQRVKRNTRGLMGGRLNTTAKHMLTLRNINDVNSIGDKPGIPQITLINSHDLSSTFFFALGWLEFVCSNGMVVLREGSYFKIRHRGITTSKIVDTVTKLAQQFPQLTEDRERFIKTPISEIEAKQFAFEAASLRFKDGVQLNYSDLLTSRYQEQSELNLWNVYNNVQRNLLNGGFHATNSTDTKQNSVRKVRKINSIDANVNLNGQLWELLDVYGRKLSPSSN